MSHKDQLQRKIKLPKTPERIVSLVPSQTELLVDLGLEDKIVGITKFCVHPKNLRSKKQIVGGTKGIRKDRIKELNPDIILCNKEENTKEMISDLEKDYQLHISDVNTLADAYELIEQYGELFEVQHKAAEISKAIKKEEESFRTYIKEKPVLKVAYFIWRKPWMVAGGKTFINHLLEINHFKNVYKQTPRYPEIEIDHLKPVDFVLLSSEPFPFGEKHKQEILPYAGSSQIALVDGEYFSWYGSRLEKAFQYFKELREELQLSD